jgi:hypothetical protein
LATVTGYKGINLFTSPVPGKDSILNVISEFIASNFFYVFLAVIALTLFQRKYGKKVLKKRLAVLFIAILVFALHINAVFVMEFKLNDAYLLIWAAVAGTLLYFKWDVIVPFKRKCVSCDRIMTFNEIVFDDSNTCEKCRPKDEEEENQESS